MSTFNPTDHRNRPSLSPEEVKAAKKELIKDVKTFPRVNRRFEDPVKAGEPKFALFTYIDNPDTEMNSFLNDIKTSLKPQHKQRLEELQKRPNRVNGVAKIRGAYMTLQEAEARAEEIVRDIDSSNSVFTCIMGVPFPLVSEGMAEEVTRVDLQQQTEQTISENVRRQRLNAQKEMEAIKMREEELMRNVEKDPDAVDLDKYTVHRVKLAHLRYSIQQHTEKSAECVENEKKCVELLLEMKNKHPEFEEAFMEKYMAGRKAANIPEDQVSGFMKYLNDPLIKLDG